MAAQIPDRILKDGEWLNLFTNPLEQYWIKLRKRRPMFSSRRECKRGYIADWEIRDHQLFIVGIEGTFLRKTFLFGRKLWKFSLKWLFSGKIQPRKAFWFSGKLRIPLGKMLLYDDEYNARFEQEQIITVEEGDILKAVTLDYTQRKLIVHTDTIVRSAKNGQMSGKYQEG